MLEGRRCPGGHRRSEEAEQAFHVGGDRDGDLLGVGDLAHRHVVHQMRGAGRDLTIRDSSPASKPVHVLTITLRATEPGELNRTLRIVTDIAEDNEIEFQTTGQIVP